MKKKPDELLIEEILLNATKVDRRLKVFSRWVKMKNKSFMFCFAHDSFRCCGLWNEIVLLVSDLKFLLFACSTSFLGFSLSYKYLRMKNVIWDTSGIYYVATMILEPVNVHCFAVCLHWLSTWFALFFLYTWLLHSHAIINKWTGIVDYDEKV